MQNEYVSGEVENFHSHADFGFVCEFLMDCIDDPRYNGSGSGRGVDAFDYNMMNFIYGVGQ